MKVPYLRDSLRGLQVIASINTRLNPIKLFLLGALANSVAMLPVLLAVAPRRPLTATLPMVLEVSAMIARLGFLG